jgi:hypothetical protein
VRILIYSECPEAIQLQETLRGENHHASLRNPNWFSDSDTEKADIVYSVNNRILAAYRKAGIETRVLDKAPTVEPKAKTRGK